MFNLRTGTPGSGKTLSLIAELRHIKDRPIYYYGIPDLSPSLGWKLIENPQNYHNEITDGSIFILDECQKHFPVRPPKDPVPAAMQFIETHRHRGIDIHFITQHPSLLDHHARRLVGFHTHLQRNFGMPFAAMYTNNKLFDYNNYHELQTCQKSRFDFPKDVYQLYKSAEVHTHKLKLPKKLFLIPLLLALVGFCVYKAWETLHKAEKTKLSPVPGYQIDHSGSASVDTGQKKEIDWTTAFTPKIKGLPYTAPIYKSLAVPTALPVVAGCLASAKRCKCYTQQATVVDMADELCRLNVKNHQFNPFKEKTEPRFVQNQQDPNIRAQNDAFQPVYTGTATVEQPLALTEFDFDTEPQKPRSITRNPTQSVTAQ